MMNILIKRTYFRANKTVGFLQVNGKYLCDVLEQRSIPWTDDPFLKQKAGKRRKRNTAIPEGVYEVTVTQSVLHQTELAVIKGVPNFNGAAFYDCDGCFCHTGDISLGKLATVPKDKEGHPADEPRLVYKQVFLQKLCKMIRKAEARGEKVLLTVRSPRGWGMKDGKGG